MDRVIFNMATIPQRVFALEDSIKTILPQCDELNIYMNGWDQVPEFLSHPKINVFRSQYELGDLGDVGKFFCCDSWDGYIFTVDDKILYPPNYVKEMIASIEKYGRKAVVSCHGRLFHARPSKSYYFDIAQPFYCVYKQPEVFVHEIGTGVLAFHTDTVKVDLDWFPCINMTDIWFSMEMQKREIPMLIHPHPAGYVKVSPKHDESYSIHAYCNKNDSYQTEVINSFAWKVFTADKVL
jgi:hypothetical protein